MIEQIGASTIDLTTAFASGEADDPVGGEGLAHLVEHLWFEARVSGETVGERYGRLGCASNAATGGAWMSFSVSCPPEVLRDVLSLEAERLKPWDIDPAVLRREWGVVTVEHRERLESSWDRERDLLTRQLLPPTHPMRLRAARPDLGAMPTLEQVRAFVAERLRAEVATVGLVGPPPAAEARAALDGLYGAGQPAQGLPPMRPVSTVAEALRMAPRTVHGVALRPVVHVAWSRPVPPGDLTAILETYIELKMEEHFTGDPRVRGVACSGIPILGLWSFGCGIEARDDAAAVALGEGVPGLLSAMAKVEEEAPIRTLAESQGVLWSMAVWESRGTDQGNLSMVLARGLLGDVIPEGRPVGLARYLKADPLDRNALVLVLTGDGRPEAPPALPAVDLPLPPPHAWPAPVPPLPVAAGTRIREDGLRLAAVQLPDLALAHIVLAANAEWSAEGWRAALGAGPAPGTDRVGWVIDLDRGLPPAYDRTVATTAAGLPSSLLLLKSLLARFPYSAERAASGMERVRVELSVAVRSARTLVGLLTSAAHTPRWVVPELEAPADEEAVMARAMSPYTPARTGVAVAFTLPPEDVLAGLEVAFQDWSPEARVPPPPRGRAALPRALRVEVPGIQAWIGASCPVGRSDASAQMWAAVVGQRLVRELRERRGIAYSPSTWVDDGELGVRFSVPPGEATVGWEVVGASLGPVSEVELTNARAEVLTRRAPQRWGPEGLVRALLHGSLDAESLRLWARHTAATDVAALDELSGRCRADLARVLAGPPETAWPAEATAMPVEAVERWVYGR